jgi:hypothetical protein
MCVNIWMTEVRQKDKGPRQRRSVLCCVVLCCVVMCCVVLCCVALCCLVLCLC